MSTSAAEMASSMIGRCEATPFPKSHEGSNRLPELFEHHQIRPVSDETRVKDGLSIG